MYKKIAEETYKIFSEQEGNEHIASEGALRYILKYLRRRSARNMLEIGTGIGTVCFAVLRGVEAGYLDRDLAYYGTEADPFCNRKIRENIGIDPRVHMFESFHAAPATLRFDVAVVDGQDSALALLPERMNRRGIIFVEGGRGSQINQLKNLFNTGTKRNFVIFSEIAFIKRPYGPFVNRPYGGGTVIILNPTVVDYLYFFMRKTATKWKYRGGLIG